MNPSGPMQPCLVCRRLTTQWCSRCHNAFYCSEQHNRANWPEHRPRCHPLPSLIHGSNMIAMPPPAEPEYFSVHAVLFLSDEDRPRIINVKCHRPPHGLCPVPHLQPYFDALPASFFLTEALGGQLLRFPLHVLYSPAALAHGSPINHAIRNITSGASCRPWYGNVVVLKFNGSRRQGYTDAGSNDLPVLSAHFLLYR
ncbi:hypothetical protein DFH06DRAFT_990034 [Mycena polygramma]|nr:hypothetical protein DFH06DRAFT_990034 [Mycena polygramma]